MRIYRTKIGIATFLFDMPKAFCAGSSFGNGVIGVCRIFVSFLGLFLLETPWNKLKYCLKGPINAKDHSDKPKFEH